MCKVKYGNNFWTDCPILKIFSDTWSENVLPLITKKRHFNRIEIEGDIEFEIIELCNISKTNSPILKLFSPADLATIVSG